MCGIFGLAGQAIALHERVGLVERANDLLTHRGPDDAGVWHAPSGHAALAMRRLSIVDLSPAGHQPMCAVASGVDVVLVFNGEIYNHGELRERLRKRGHTFRGHSDTEVLLAAYLEWGTEFVKPLVGMFAIAMYDGRSNELILVRDRAGEKPVFYHHAPGRLTFASELKAILADDRVPRRLSLQALNYYLAFGYVPSNGCILEGCSKLPPGHLLVYNVENDTLRTRPYWQLPAMRSQTVADPNELVDELESLLGDAVRAQMQADVPVGIMLSGGIDSSLVTALAARTIPQVRTFTVSMPTGDHYDESPFARQVAAHFGSQHIELEAEPASVSLLPMLARQFDEPIADSSMVPTYLLSKLIRNHAKVALGGDGGDELFGGYAHHRWLLQQEQIRHLTGNRATALLKPIEDRMLPGRRGRNFIAALAGPPDMAFAKSTQYFDAAWRRSLVAEFARHSDFELTAPERFKAQLSYHAGSLLQKATAVDFMSYLPADILVKVDRSSMLTSLEVRAPWLDHRLIEFAFSRVPDALRATPKRAKILPKLLAERLLPSGLPLERKQGFTIPLHAWFRGSWGDYMADTLQGAPPELFNQGALQKLINYQRRGLANTQRLFALTMLELWRREYGVALPSA